MAFITRMLRDTSNPFEIDDVRFIELFRLPKGIVQNIIAAIKPKFEQTYRSTAIPVHLKVHV